MVWDCHKTNVECKRCSVEVLVTSSVSKENYFIIFVYSNIREPDV